MYLAGNLAFATYIVFLSFLDSINQRESLLFVRGIPLGRVFWKGCISGLYAGLSIVFKELATYSYGPALLFLQFIQFPCGFLCAQYTGQSLFGAFAPGEKNVGIWLFRFGISFLGVITGIFFAAVGGKVLGI